MTEDIPSKKLAPTEKIEHSRQFIGSREGIASTTNVELSANSRPKKSSG